MSCSKALKVLTFIVACVIYNSSFSQGITITGTVTSEDGPLPGVNIMVEGGTYGNITDSDGKYVLVSPNPDIRLVFSYVGYETVHEYVGNRTVVDIFMEVDVSQLEEIVVTGYTTQAVKNFSGAIDVVDVESMQTVPTSNVTEQLQGRAPGVTVTQSGMPGAPISVRIRGYGTINQNDPLYIIDGAPADQYTIEMLNPDDIESVQVLKDASAASIYGARAASGVILITTKSGKDTGKTNFSFSGYVGVQHVTNLPEFCTPEEVAMIQKISKENAGITLEHPQYLLSDSSWGLPDYLIPAGHSIDLDGPINESDYVFPSYDSAFVRADKEGTKWLEQIFRPALIQNYFLTATSGGEKGKFAITLGYFDQEGVVKYNQYKKFTFRVNTLFNVSKRFRIGETFALSYHNLINDVGMQGTFLDANIISEAMASADIIPIYDVGDNYSGNIQGIGGSNLIANLERSKDNSNQYFRLLGSFFFELDILKDLTLKSSLSPNLKMTFENKVFSPKQLEDPDPGINSLNQYVDNSFNWTWYSTLYYNKTFSDSHNFRALVGFEAIEDKTTYQFASISNFYSDDLSFRHLSKGQELPQVDGITTEWSLLSIFAKVDYDFRAKYIVSATVRRDGSSRFGGNNKYALFPAFSAAWRMSAENFMQGADALNDLKFRIGWGQTGNQNIGNYRIYNSYSTNYIYAAYDIEGKNNDAQIGISPAYFGNANTKWETSTTLNAGIDLAMFNNKLTFTIDWYDRNTTGMLIEVPTTALKGVADEGYSYENIGELNNTGIDFSLFYNSLQNRKFTWSAGINFTHYKNKVVKLYNSDQIYWGGNDDWAGLTSRPNVTMEGYPISSFYGLNIIGIFQNKQEIENSPIQKFKYTINTEGDTTWHDVGRWKYEDVNKNDSIDYGTPGEDDRKILGSPHPDFTFGLPINLQFKGFFLNMFWYGSYGNEIYNANKRTTDILYGYWGEDFNNGLSKRVLNSWGMEGVDNADAKLPQINQNVPDMELRSGLSYYIEDGSFLRLQQLIFGYNFNTKSWNGVEQFRIYLQANNVFTITNYEGIDPMITRSEINNAYGTVNDFSLGTDLSQYPYSRTFLMGMNITF